MKKRKNSMAGKIIVSLFLLVEAVFLGLLFYTKMVPQKYMIGIGAVLLIMLLLVGFLTRSTRKKGSFTAGILLAFLFASVFILGGNYIYQAASTLSSLSGVDTEIAEVGIYVRTEDTAASIEDAGDYTFGVLSQLDRKNTDETLAVLGEELKKEILTKEYQGLSELIDGLMKEETGAVVLNQAYLPVIEEMEGYEDITSRIREISVKHVETVIETGQQVETEDKEDTPEEILTVFISGIDNRGGIVAKSRSDVNIIAVANTKTKQLLLVSTPRDYFVPLSISNGIPDKLTHAGIYGVDVCMGTLGMLYDIEINDYFRLNFAGFEKIIDSLGGVTVMSDYDFSTSKYHYNKGQNVLGGKEALAFARERYSFAAGDRQRGKNQMEVIKGVISKASSPELLKNYSSVMASMEGCFETSIPYDKIGSLIQQQLTSGGTWNVVSYSADGTGDTQKPYSMSQKAYVMIPDYATVDKAKELIQKVCDGEIITQE